jgi:hypothetical protein
MPRAQAAAIEYLAHGWRVVPVPLESKRPVLPGWPSTVFEADAIGEGNVGVILGPVSGDLVDIDIDSKAALELAPYFLPPTLTFGRASKPRSHWLYTCKGVRSSRLSFRVGDDVELVEIRAKNASNDECGHHTVFPGSTHTSGELIDWDAQAECDEPQPIDAGALIWAASRLAVASVIIDGWGEGAQRNALTMAYAGGLLAMGWAAEEVRELLQAVREVAEDDDESATKNEGAVERTIAAFEAGTPVTGFATLVREGLVDARKVKDIERHGKTPAARARDLKVAQTSAGRLSLERMIREAQDVDALVDVADVIAQRASGEPKEVTCQPVDGATRLGRIASLATPPEPLNYICEGLGIAPGKISAIGGYAGTGKGPLLDLFAVCVASGRAFLGHKVERRKVCFLDAETGALVETRLKRIANALDVDLAKLEAEDWFTLIHAQPPIDDEYCALLESMLERGMLVCVDSYTSAAPGEQNDASIADAAFRMGRMSTALDVTFAVAVHNKKTQKSSDASDLEMISGHNALVAAMQTAITLARPDEADRDLIEVRCARAPEESFKTFRLRWEDVAAPDARDTRGGRLKASKWGLRAAVQAAELGQDSEVRQELEATAAAEAHIMTTMAAHYPDGLQAPVDKLGGTSDSHATRRKRSAIRNLIRSGRLLANYAWDTPVRGGPKQHVWLPGPRSQIGVVQRP